ncbi:hypothetical protein Bca52824_018502 [Brassica carinata]|uniref:Transcription repressor n=1 Tax=Brassica carinata TaxID=52824 RepID=A0A8X7VQ86_BRACI|nr:hypothetical protein Bca52824_018502 [Brassica carinata]
MMKWGRKKHVPSSSFFSCPPHVSWFSKLSGSYDLKPAKEKKQDDEATQKMSALSSSSCSKRRNDVHESSKRLQKAPVEKEDDAIRLADMESNEKFKEIMSSVRKKARDIQRETSVLLDVEAMDRDKGTMIMTPRIQVKRDKKRCDQTLLQQKPKRSEQEAEAKMKKPATSPRTRNYSSEDFVKLKADQQRKSMYIRRGLGKKEKSKVRVFSPRACRVKTIEDLKKAKLRAREHHGGGMEKESFAVVTCSSDPQKDFRDSMVEMIMENGIINHPEELKELLVCYLTLNTDEYHDMIINVFKQVHRDLSLN